MSSARTRGSDRSWNEVGKGRLFALIQDLSAMTHTSSRPYATAAGAPSTAVPARVIVSCGGAPAIMSALAACNASAPSKPKTTSASAFGTMATPSTGTTATEKPVAFVNASAVSVGSCAPPTRATVTTPEPERGVGALIVPCKSPGKPWAPWPGTTGAAKGSCGALDDTDDEHADRAVAAAARADSAKTKRARAMTNPSDGNSCV